MNWRSIGCEKSPETHLDAFDLDIYFFSWSKINSINEEIPNLVPFGQHLCLAGIYVTVFVSFCRSVEKLSLYNQTSFHIIYFIARPGLLFAQNKIMQIERNSFLVGLQEHRNCQY